MRTTSGRCRRGPSLDTRYTVRPWWASCTAHRSPRWASSSSSCTSATCRGPSFYGTSWEDSLVPARSENWAGRSEQWDRATSSCPPCERVPVRVPIGRLVLPIGVRSLCGRPDSNRHGAIGFFQDPPHRGPSPARLPFSPRPPEGDRPEGRPRDGIMVTCQVSLFRVNTEGRELAQSDSGLPWPELVRARRGSHPVSEPVLCLQRRSGLGDLDPTPAADASPVG